MLIIGHGSLQPNNLLNSRESFEIARESGADGVEMDVRMSVDAQLLVTHDPIFPDGQKVSASLAEDRLPSVLLLEEALDLCIGTLAVIEIKNYPGDPCYDSSDRVTDLIIDTLEERGNTDNVILSCFGIDSLNHVRERRPELSTALLLLSRRPPASLIKPCSRSGHSIVYPHAPMVTDEFVRIARARELSICPWTSFDETEQLATKMIKLGLDGLLTAYPARAVKLRKEILGE